MNKIGFPRIDVDGNEYDQQDLEKWYIQSLNIVSEIYDRLMNNVNVSNSREERLLNHLKRYLPQILLMTPSRMQMYTGVVDRMFGNLLIHTPRGKKTTTPFGEAILAAFNYSYYRTSKLEILAKKINVKTCPYCNLSYTLYAEIKHPGKRKKVIVDKFAKMQFDHFYDKKSFPMLSMSLYNLIPSCSICNQGKSAHSLPLVFHPYVSDIQSLFTFEVVNPLSAYQGAIIPDHVDVQLNWSPSIAPNDIKVFEDTFHLNAMYSRQGDIVQEVFDKAYETPYYLNPSNFSFLSGKDVEYLERLWFGHYMGEKDIHKRPLSKFVQDVRKQAEIGKRKLEDLME